MQMDLSSTQVFSEVNSMAIVAPSHQGATLCYNQTSLIRIAILCLLISSAVQLSLPLINEYGKWLLFFAHSYVKCVLFTSCNNTTSQDFSLARQNDPTFFPEIFPVETWTGAKPVAIVPQISEDEVPDRAREQEALAALSAAQSSRRSGNIKRAKMIIEHAVALAPNHPDILTEYGLFHEV
nr:Adenosine monophosphate-protein transferase [Haemonchus contortus]